MTKIHTLQEIQHPTMDVQWITELVGRLERANADRKQLIEDFQRSEGQTKKLLKILAEYKSNENVLKQLKLTEKSFKKNDENYEEYRKIRKASLDSFDKQMEMLGF